MNYTVISGFHRKDGFTGIDPFFKIWIENVQKMSPPPQQVIIIADNNARPPMDELKSAPPFPVTVIPLRGDLGNCHMTLNRIKTHKYGGWNGVVLSGALLCYANETDMIFVEEDALQFGDTVKKMYEEIGDAGIIFGSCNFMPAAQSLFLLKHSYINEFVRLILGRGAQDKESELGEHQFVDLERQFPALWKRFSFGYDRSRPINYDDAVWYAQHWTPEEMEELRKRNLI